MEKKEKKGEYFEGLGRRKTSTARVRITEAGRSSFSVNEMDVKSYFKTEEERKMLADALLSGGKGLKFSIEVKVSGGGHHSQAEAVRHGLARALVLFDGNLRSELKELGYLKRDPRAKERRKFGLKKARKAPQWSKR